MHRGMRETACPSHFEKETTSTGGFCARFSGVGCPEPDDAVHCIVRLFVSIFLQNSADRSFSNDLLFVFPSFSKTVSSAAAFEKGADTVQIRMADLHHQLSRVNPLPLPILTHLLLTRDCAACRQICLILTFHLQCPGRPHQSSGVLHFCYDLITEISEKSSFFCKTVFTF